MSSPQEYYKYLDREGRVKVWPSKGKKIAREEILQYLASKFDFQRDYKEREVNEILIQWHTFGDYFLLRRELIIAGLLSRTNDGSKYWKEPIHQKGNMLTEGKIQ